MCLDVLQSASGTAIRYTISSKNFWCLWHWQDLGKCSWGSDFTWSLPFKIAGLVNNVLRKRLSLIPRPVFGFLGDFGHFSPSLFLYHFFAIERWIMMHYPLCCESLCIIIDSIIMSRFQMLHFHPSVYCSYVTFIFHHTPDMVSC